MKGSRCFNATLVVELVIILIGFGISCWIFAQVPDSENVLGMVPICFTGWVWYSKFEDVMYDKKVSKSCWFENWEIFSKSNE